MVPNLLFVCWRGRGSGHQNVAGTNVIEIAAPGSANRPLIVMSAEDNLVKGASGQAVQSMNMCGYPETTGLI